MSAEVLRRAAQLMMRERPCLAAIEKAEMVGEKKMEGGGRSEGGARGREEGGGKERKAGRRSEERELWCDRILCFLQEKQRRQLTEEMQEAGMKEGGKYQT